jgi:phosphatidylserine synthase
MITQNNNSIKTFKFLAVQLCTGLRIVVSALALITAINNQFISSINLIVIGIVLDSLDGPLSRKFNVTSEFGSLFDYYGDYLGNVVVPSVIVYLLLRSHIGNLSVAVASLPILTGAIRYSRNIVEMKRRSFEDAGYPGLGTVFFALFIVEIIFLDIETFIGSSNFSLLIILATLIFSLMMNLPLRYPKLTKFPLLNICICAILIMNLFFFTKLIAVLVLVTILSYAFISPFAFRT